jgi:4-amino-4-deoxy-L-arabinose transferase-like glycosyltransferase
MSVRAAPLPRLGGLATLAVVFIAAAVVRFDHIGDPPLDFHPTRQYRSALLARRFYVEHNPSVPAWQRALAVHNADETYEFPLLQCVAALGYRAVGGEDLRIPRAISVLAWLVGGLLVYVTARRFATGDGATVATAFFLLVPFGVDASRAFHPDGIMVALLVLTYLALLEYGKRGGGWRLLGAAASGGLATLVKPVAIFQVVGGFLAVWYLRRRHRGDGGLLQLAAFAVGVLALGGLYYMYEWLHAGTLAGVAQQIFLPRLLLTFTFWKGWLAQVWKVVGFLAPAAAVLGFVALPKGVARSMVGGLAAGYLVFGLCFSYTTFTHDYYHLQLIPLVAVALAPLVDRCAGRLRSAPFFASAPTGLVLGVVFVAAVLDISTLSYYRKRGVSFDSEVAAYREVGRVVGHGSKNVLLANYYAYPLRYYGELGGTYWPLSFDARFSRLAGLPQESARERLAAVRAQTGARYFVVTDLPELRAQPDLDRLLATGFAVFASTDRYVIYDLEAPRRVSTPGP